MDHIAASQGVGASMQATRMHMQSMGKDGKPKVTIFDHLLSLLLFAPVALFRDDFPPHHWAGSFDMFDGLNPEKIMATFSGQGAIPGIMHSFRVDTKFCPFDWEQPIDLNALLEFGKQADQERAQIYEQERAESNMRHEQESAGREQERQAEHQRYEHELDQDRQQKVMYGLLHDFPGAAATRQREYEHSQQEAQRHHVDHSQHGQLSPHQQRGGGDIHEHERQMEREREYTRYIQSQKVRLF
jgi:hypothetical protein